MKTFSMYFATAALFGFAFSPGLAVAQAQPIVSLTRLVPLDITGRYAVPRTAATRNLARYELLTADPFKDIAAGTAIAAPPPPSTVAAR